MSKTLHWVVIDRGCIECGEEDILLSVHHSEAGAQQAKLVHEEERRRLTPRLVVLKEGNHDQVKA